MQNARNIASGRRHDLLLAVAAGLVLLAGFAASGAAPLANLQGDNDSLLRLVEVRDLLGGQGWFDLHQYRMGLEGGFVMHWSRLVDAPVAAIVLLVKAAGGGEAMAEAVAAIVWPTVLYVLNVYVLARAARVFGGDDAALPAGIIGAAGLYFLGIFKPGSLDHHNVQLLLATAALYLLMAAPALRRAAAGSGLCCALMLAVGMETAPFVAAFGAATALLFLAGGSAGRIVARDFGAAFALTAALVFLATVPPSAWTLSSAACDAFSSFQLVVAAVGGGGLALICGLGRAGGTLAGRALSLAGLALLVALALAVLFPQCLAAPYGNLDPKLKELWLDHIVEAQPLWELLATDRSLAVARYATPALAILLMVLRLRQGPWRREDSLVAALLVAAFATSIWQVRGSTFSIAFAVIPLSAWVASWRRRAGNHPSPAASLRMAVVWLVSFNATWTGAAAAASRALQGPAAPVSAAGGAEPCENRGDFAGLAAQPATRVLAVSNLGSAVLAYTGHSVFAGPYHRNVDGNLMALDMLTGDPEATRTLALAHGVGLVALCRGNSETGMLVRVAPDGFVATLVRGPVPAWLLPVGESLGQPLELYRVR